MHPWSRGPRGAKAEQTGAAAPVHRTDRHPEGVGGVGQRGLHGPGQASGRQYRVGRSQRVDGRFGRRILGIGHTGRGPRPRRQHDQRHHRREPSQLTVGDLVVDVAGHTVKRDGTELSLTPLEFDLLVALASKPNQVFDRESLLEKVWGYRHAGDTRLVNVHVQRLRSKIERDPENPTVVVTVRGVGYKAGGA